MTFFPRLGQARGAGDEPGRAALCGPAGRAISGAVPDTGRTCALDPGRARVGLAIDDDLGLLAHPRGTLDPRDAKAFAARLRELADNENVSRFVVGLPLHMRGGEGASAREARALAQLVADATGRVVEMWDERLSTE